jgi:DNA-binding NarL/FixJ family response regulator
MGSLPALTQLSPAAAGAYDVILVGCTERLLLSPPFRARAYQLSRTARLIALMPSPTPGAGAQAASLGFVGLVSSDVTPRALERTIAATAQGDSAFPRTVLNGLVQMVSRLSSTRLGSHGDVALTPRQEQIVDLIAQGATDREIAGLLQISQSTAHKHVQNALRRLNAKTRSQLVASVRQAALPRSFVD